jgi:serine/threonine protein kinase
MANPLPPSLRPLAAALSDRYLIQWELGQGGMATVYLARDIRHDRLVAVKVLHAELAAMIGAERFLTEIKTTAALQHPNILPLLDSGGQPMAAPHGPEPAAESWGRRGAEFLFYVMPYVEGETLRDRRPRSRIPRFRRPAGCWPTSRTPPGGRRCTYGPSPIPAVPGWSRKAAVPSRCGLPTVGASTIGMVMP